MSEQLDENDPFYASKKWGPDYRHKDEYWKWKDVRDAQQRAQAAASKPENVRHESIPYFVKRGW